MRKHLRLLFISYIPNFIVNKIPSYKIRHFYYKYVLKIQIGKGTSIHLNTKFFEGKLIIGTNTTINRNCFFDTRGTIFIGNNVSISPDVHFITADHDINTPYFEYRQAKIHIDNYVFIGTRATILPGVYIGEGAVVCAGAVVNNNVPAFTIVGGVPAKKIGDRISNLDYICNWFMPFD